MSSIATSASADDWAKTRLDNSRWHLEWVKVQSEQRTVNSFIAYPDIHDKATEAVAIYETFGEQKGVRPPVIDSDNSSIFGDSKAPMLINSG